MKQGMRRVSLEAAEMLGYVGLATLTQWSLSGHLGTEKSFTAFFASTLLTSVRCDWPLAAVAALLGYGVGQFWLGSIETPASEGVRGLMYLLISVLVIACSQRMRLLRSDVETYVSERVAEQNNRRDVETDARCTAIARDMDRLKTDFLKTVSHELRTPMNAIIGFTDLLTDGQAGTLNPTQEEYVHTVRESARELLGVLDTVLDTAAVLSGRTTASPALIDPAETIALALQEVEPRVRAKKLTLVGPSTALPPLSTDGRKLKQILLLLLDNAVKFTPRGRIEVSATQRERGLTIEVADTGVGIPADNRAHIFELFRQGSEGLARQHGGTGAGLFLARELARLLGGDLVAAPCQKGARFVLQIPDAGVTEPYRQPSLAAGDHARHASQPPPSPRDIDDATKPAH